VVRQIVVQPPFSRYSTEPRSSESNVFSPKSLRNDGEPGTAAFPSTKAIPVVVLTSSKEDRDLVDGYQLGVNAYAQKPVDFEQFSGTVRQIGMFWMLVNQAPRPGTPMAGKARGA
jgi:CheY-like chemotaxis protein